MDLFFYQSVDAPGGFCTPVFYTNVLDVSLNVFCGVFFSDENGINACGCLVEFEVLSVYCV